MSALNLFRPKPKEPTDLHGEAQGLVTYAILAIGDATDALDEAVEFSAKAKARSLDHIKLAERRIAEHYNDYDAAHSTFTSADKLHNQLNALTAGLVLGE